MNTRIRRVLRKVVEKVLVDFAYVYAEPTAELVLWTASKYLCASISFRGDLSGTLYLAATPALCRAMAGNVLGVSESRVRKSGGLEKDVLKELANIVCGNLVHRLGGRSATITLAPPRSCRLSAACREHPERMAGLVAFTAEDSKLIAGIDVKDSAS